MAHRETERATLSQNHHSRYTNGMSFLTNASSIIRDRLQSKIAGFSDYAICAREMRARERVTARSGSNLNVLCGSNTMAEKTIPSPEQLRQLLRYEPETGRLFWKERGLEFVKARNMGTWNARYAGKEAFVRTDEIGRKCGEIFTRPYKAHRVIWAMQTGQWPADCIDHIDRDPSNNKWENLRAATRSQNQHNRSKTCKNTSGFKGVFFDKRRGLWVAAITFEWKPISLGYFSSAEDAAVAYANAAEKYHGEFARTE